MKTVTAVIHVELVKNELSPNEKAPELHVFWDGRFKRRAVKTSLTRPSEITVQGQTNVNELPQTTSIVFSAFAWRENAMNLPCLMDAGTNHIPIKAVIDDKRPFNMPIVMHNVQNYEKAVIRITVKRLDLAGIDIVNKSFINSDIVPYIEAQMDSEQQMRDTIPGTSRMRVPYDYSEAGFELTGAPMPFLSFGLAPLPNSNEEFWRNAFTVVMRRDDLKRGDWKRLSKTGKARVMALMNCLVAQYLDYASDTVDTNTGDRFDKSLIKGCESFDSGLTTLTGDDCEDGGQTIRQSNGALQNCKIEDPILKEIQQISEQYIAYMSLDVVNGAQVVDEDAPKGAHMNTNLVPIAQFREWMQQTRQGKLNDSKLKKLYPKNIDKELPFLVGEGTGMLEPLGYDCKKMNLMAYVYQLPSLKRFKKPILRRRGEAGAFLLGSLKGVTDYFVRRGVNIGGITYTTMQRDGSQTRGAYYEDMMNDRNDVAVRLDPPVSSDTMDLIKETNFLRDPPHDLVLSKEYDKSIERNEHLDYVCEQVAKYRRQPGDELKRVSVFVRPTHLNAKLATDIAWDVKKLTKVWKVDYRLERVTDELYGYEMRFFIQ